MRIETGISSNLQLLVRDAVGRGPFTPATFRALHVYNHPAGNSITSSLLGDKALHFPLLLAGLCMSLHINFTLSVQFAS